MFGARSWFALSKSDACFSNAAKNCKNSALLVRAVAAKTLLINKVVVMPRDAMWATKPAAKFASWCL